MVAHRSFASSALLLCATLPVTFSSPTITSPHLPIFSWNTVPAFFHSSVMNGSTFGDSDMQIIAQYPAVTIEKWQGCASPDLPSQFNATLQTATKLKQMNPSISVFIWLDSLRIYANTSLNPDARNIENQTCVRNDITPFVETHGEEYLLHNTSGMPAEEPYCHFHVYNHLNQNTRDLWRDACVNLTKTGMIDGCGADASQQTGTYVIGLAPDVSAAWTLAHEWAVGNTTEAVSAAGGVILGKLGSQLGVTTNGVLQEGCVAGNATINTLQQAGEASKRDGRPYVYECHSNGTPDDLAAFLIGVQENQYWGFGTWMSPSGGVYARIPELEYKLGAPLNEGMYDVGTHTWSRNFASGTNVTFNAVSNKGTIVWAQ